MAIFPSFNNWRLGTSCRRANQRPGALIIAEAVTNSLVITVRVTVSKTKAMGETGGIGDTTSDAFLQGIWLAATNSWSDICTNLAEVSKFGHRRGLCWIGIWWSKGNCCKTHHFSIGFLTRVTSDIAIGVAHASHIPFRAVEGVFGLSGENKGGEDCNKSHDE